MKLFEALVLGWLAVVCVACDTACENANEKLEDECKDEIARAQKGQGYSVLPLTGGSDECGESEQCVAECINDADCASIAFVMSTGGRVRDPNAPVPKGAGPFQSCLRECHPEL